MTGEKKVNRSEQEYRKLDYLSSSDLREFSIDRKKFFKTKIEKSETRQEDEYNPALLIGSLGHNLLLEPENFDSKFYMSTCTNPPTANMLVFTESLYKHTVSNMDENGIVTEEFSNLVDLAYIDSGYKISKEKVLENFTKPNKNNGETPEMYYNQLREARSRNLQICCVDDITIAEKAVNLVLHDEFTGPIFEEREGYEYCNEQQIEGFTVEGLEMKAMLDRIVIDHNNKTIQIYDLKFVYDVVNFKREYWLKKQAYIQGYIYWRALMSGVLDLEFDYSEYEILPPIFIVAHSGCFYRPLQYKMSVEDLNKAEKGFVENEREYKGVTEIIKDILWCQENQIWNISKSAFEAGGIVNL